MEKLINPQISNELSLEAFKIAKNEYNNKVLNDSKLKLKRNHYQTMVLLIKDLIIWQEHKNEIFPENTILNQALNGQVPTINYNTTLKAIQTDSHRQTIRKHLTRLENAGIIESIFHGHKKPLEIKFNSEIVVLFDTKNKNYIPKSKYFTEEKSKCFVEKYFNGIKPQSVPCEQNVTKSDNNNVCFSTEKNNNITINEKSVLHLQNIDYYLNNNTSSISNNTTILNTNTLQTKECNSKEKIEEKEKSCEKKEKEITHKERNEQVRLDSIWTYAMIMFAYLIDNLFYDKKFTMQQSYKIECINYIAQNYFSSAQNGEQVALKFENNYKIRIDIVKKYIKNFKQKSGYEFDKKFFNPLAYLDVTKKEKNDFSFIKTNSFLEKSKVYKALNEHKKLKDNEQAYKFYNIMRQVENQRITYETALEKVRSIDMNEEIFTLMLQAKFTGEMSQKYTKRKFN